jgi:hypothetical protein
MFGWRDLDYWRRDWEEGGDSESHHAGSIQEVKAATVLLSVMKEKIARYWYQSGGERWVAARVMTVTDYQRNYEGVLMAGVRQWSSKNRCVSDSKKMLVEQGISLEVLHVKEYPPERSLRPSHPNQKRYQGQRRSRETLASEH